MLTPQELAALNAIDLDHKDVRDRASVLTKRLKNTPAEGIDESLKEAIKLEGQHITVLINLVKNQQPRVPDPADIDDQQETTREVYDEWSRGR